ncbi:MAG: DUF5067 domain-containing protein [Oscillospiraceae bacterium]
MSATPKIEEKAVSDQPKEKEISDSGDLGDYTVAIKDYRLVKDYSGKDAILVRFDFTNNSEEPQMFMVAVNSDVYQDGVELETAILIDVKDYDSAQSMKKIKKGATITVESGYVLGNLASDVEVETKELISMNDDVLKKTFKIAK